MLVENKLVLFVLFLIVLALVLILLFGFGKGTADQLLLQNELRQCCGTFRAYNCEDVTVSCNSKTIEDLRLKLNLNNQQLKEYCNCPT
jgi:hypothetical protein